MVETGRQLPISAFKSLYRVSEGLGNIPQKVDDPMLGKGRSFGLVTRGIPALLEIYPKAGTIRLSSEDEILELRKMSLPQITQEGIIFQSQEASKKTHYLNINQGGHITYVAKITQEEITTASTEEQLVNIWKEVPKERRLYLLSVLEKYTPKASDTDEYISVTEAHRLYGLSTARIRQLAPLSPDGPLITRKEGRAWYINKESLQEYTKRFGIFDKSGYITLTEASSLSGMSTSTLRRTALSPNDPLLARKEGKTWYINKESLQLYLGKGDLPITPEVLPEVNNKAVNLLEQAIRLLRGNTPTTDLISSLSLSPEGEHYLNMFRGLPLKERLLLFSYLKAELPDTLDLPGLLRVSQVSKLVGSSVTTIRGAVANGDFPGAKKIGKTWYIPESNLKYFSPRPLGRPRTNSKS